MSNRACAKEELCCRKIRVLIRAHEANIKAGNFDDAPNWRNYIRDVIDYAAGMIEGAQIAHITSEDDCPPPLP